MESNLVKTLILTITVMGIAIVIAGILLVCFKDLVTQHLRYLLPIPPIGVASYIFVCNVFGKYNGSLPKSLAVIFSEIFWATVISSLCFLFFTIFLMALVNLLRNLG